MDVHFLSHNLEEKRFQGGISTASRLIVNSRTESLAVSCSGEEVPLAWSGVLGEVLGWGNQQFLIRLVAGKAGPFQEAAAHTGIPRSVGPWA